MIPTFKQFFLAESNRVAIKHLYSPLKPTDSLSFFEAERFVEVLEGAGNMIYPAKSSVTEKIDGTSVKFGIDPDGRFFLQSSYSGPVYDPREFEIKIKNHVPTRELFMSMFPVIQSWVQGPLTNIVDRFDLEQGIKLQCEWLSTKSAKIDGDKYQFVSIKYDASHFVDVDHKFFVIKVTDFEESEDLSTTKSAAIQSLHASAPRGIQLLDTKIDTISKPIDVTKESRELREFLQQTRTEIPDIEELFAKRDKQSREAKNEVRRQLEQILKNIYDKISKAYENKGLMGEYEGLVIDLDGFKFKVINPVFWQNKGKEIKG